MSLSCWLTTWIRGIYESDIFLISWLPIHNHIHESQMSCATAFNAHIRKATVSYISTVRLHCLINASVWKTQRQIMKYDWLPQTEFSLKTTKRLKSSYTQMEWPAIGWSELGNIKFYEFVRTSFENRKTCKCLPYVCIYKVGVCWLGAVINRTKR